MNVRLALVSFVLFLAAALSAQGPYYVNGLTGTDAPGSGTSPTTPFKTIGYALAHVPPQSPTSSETVYVEGDQVYSPTTNGEVLPITPAYNVWVEGTFAVHGNLPVIGIPPGGTGIRFPGNQFFLRNAVTFRYLVFEGGDCGMRIGSDPGFRHRPRVQDCTFRHQTVAAILLQPNGTSADDPRFFQNRFEDVQIGVSARTFGNGSHVAPDVEECVFLRCGTGVALVASIDPPWAQNTSVTGQVRSCSFDQCYSGIYLETSGGNSSHDVSISHCRVANGTSGVSVASFATNSLNPQEHLAITDTAVIGCTHGIRVERPYGMGRQTMDLQIERTTIRGCTTGLGLSAFGEFLRTTRLTDVLITGCTTGLAIHEAGDPALSAIDVVRSRILANVTGIDSYIDSEASHLRLQSSIVAGNTGDGVRHHGFPGSNEPGNIGPPTRLELDGATLADDGTALRVVRTWCPVSVTNSVFGGNTQDVQLAANVQFAMDHSCTQNSSWAGAGNLANTDPQLVRPFYKLAPTSPCIDAGATTATSPTTDYEGDARAAVGVPSGPALPDQGADEFVLAGSARPYGTPGWGVFNVFPRISTPGPDARIGQSLQVDMTGAFMPYFPVVADFAVLTMGFDEDAGALPFALAVYGMTGSYLWNTPRASLPLQIVSPTGTASTNVTLPNAPQLVGFVFTNQWFALMPGVYGVIGSEGLRVTIGQ